MPRQTPILTSFAGGEASPLLGGRVDVQRYFTTCAVLENFIATPQGPAVRRPGTVFAGHTRSDTTQRARLVPFIFGSTDAYVLELTNYNMRVWRNRGQVLNGAVPYEITTPWGESHLPDLQWAQSGDVLIVTHPAIRPQRLARYGHTNWTITPLETQDGPYAPENPGAITITPSALTGSITLTASANLFTASMVGQPFRIKQKWMEGTEELTGWRWVLINAVTDPVTATATVQGDDLKTLDPSVSWREPAWTSARGWPRAISYHEQRLFFGATTAQPQTLWASRSTIYDDFGVSDEVTDNDALSYTIAANQVNAIQWLRSSSVLIAGTSAGEWSISGSTAGEPLTPTSVAVRQQSSHGSAPVAPVQIGRSVLFVQRGGVKLREIAYSFQDDGFASPDLTVGAEHIARPGGIREMAWTASPYPVLWMCLNPGPDGQEGGGALIGMTFEKDQQAYGFHRHPTGQGIEAGIGSTHSSNLHRVESLCAIPTPFGTDDDLWMVVRRPIGAQGFRRCMEILRGDGVRVEMDCALLKDTAPLVSSVSGLGHLNGEPVWINADGGTERPQTVSGGTLALDAPAATVSAGLPFISRLVTQRIEAGAADGTAQARKKLVSKVRIRLLNSRSGVFGVPGGRMDPIPIRTEGDALGSAPPLFSGDVSLQMPGGWGNDGQIEIGQKSPQPMTVLSIVPSVSTND